MQTTVLNYKDLKPILVPNKPQVPRHPVKPTRPHKNIRKSKDKHRHRSEDYEQA